MIHSALIGSCRCSAMPPIANAPTIKASSNARPVSFEKSCAPPPPLFSKGTPNTPSGSGGAAPRRVWGRGESERLRAQIRAARIRRCCPLVTSFTPARHTQSIARAVRRKKISLSENLVALTGGMSRRIDRARSVTRSSREARQPAGPAARIALPAPATPGQWPPPATGRHRKELRPVENAGAAGEHVARPMRRGAAGVASRPAVPRPRRGSTFEVAGPSAKAPPDKRANATLERSHPPGSPRSSDTVQRPPRKCAIACSSAGRCVRGMHQAPARVDLRGSPMSRSIGRRPASEQRQSSTSGSCSAIWMCTGVCGACVCTTASSSRVTARGGGCGATPRPPLRPAGPHGRPGSLPSTRARARPGRW